MSCAFQRSGGMSFQSVSHAIGKETHGFCINVSNGDRALYRRARMVVGCAS